MSSSTVCLSKRRRETVGYGNIAPETTWGRITVFAYGMIGIPIMVVCVAMIGEVMANVFRFVYIQLCCCGLCARRARRRRREREAAERRRRRSERATPSTNPPSWTQLYQEQMSISCDQQQPVVVDDYDDLLDDEVLHTINMRPYNPSETKRNYSATSNNMT